MADKEKKVPNLQHRKPKHRGHTKAQRAHNKVADEIIAKILLERAAGRPAQEAPKESPKAEVVAKKTSPKEESRKAELSKSYIEELAKASTSDWIPPEEDEEEQDGFY